MTRIGISGFGRIGRLAFRAAFDRKDIDVVHINEIKGGIDAAAHLLKFDSLKGRWPHEVAVDHDNGVLVIDDSRKVSFSEISKPESIPWAELGVEFVIESTGKFVTVESLSGHFVGGAKRVIVAAPVNDPCVLNVVMGVNDHLYDHSKHNIVTAASCTTNCLAPLVKVILENVGIIHGSMTTIHCVTNTQVIVDAPHKDLRRARSCLTSLVPTTTGSAKAITMIYPEL